MKKTLSILAILIIAGTSVFAQGVQFLINPADAVNFGLGGAAVATDATPFAIYNNPASMALSGQKVGVGFSYGNWQPKAAENSLVSLSGYYNFKEKFGIGIGYRSFSHQPYQITSNGSSGGTFKPKENAIDLGVSYRVISNLSVGVNAKYIGSVLGEDMEANSFGVDLGLMYQLDQLNLGLSATNVGSKINYGGDDYSLPMMVKFGGAYNFEFNEIHKLMLTAEVDYLEPASSMMAGFGAQYTFNDLLKVRSGYHYGDKTKALPSYFASGLGLQFFGVSVDFSILLSSQSEALKNTFMFGLSYSL